VSFGDHVPYLRVLAPRKDVQGTVYLWAEGASLTYLTIILPAFPL